MTFGPHLVHIQAQAIPMALPCATLATMGAVLTTTLGRFLAIADELLGIALGDRRELCNCPFVA